MNPRPLPRGRTYLLKHTSRIAQAVATCLESRINVRTFEAESEPAELAMNDIGQIKLLTSKPIVFDAYAANRLTGSFILIEPGTNATVAAGMLLPAPEPFKPEYDDFAI